MDSDKPQEQIRPEPPEAGEAIKPAKGRHRGILDSMLEGCQIIGFDWRYLYVNDAVVRQSRKSKAELLGRTMMEAFPGIEQTEMFRVLRHCMQERTPNYIENEFHYPDGSTGWFELAIQPIPEGIFILSIDITDRKKADKVQEAIYRISQAVVSTGSMPELYRSIHHILGELMPVENFYIALYDPENNLLSFPYFVDQYDPPTPDGKPGRGLTEYVLRTRRPLLASQQVFDQLVAQGEVELIGTDSCDWLGVPLKTEEKIIGVMVAQSYCESVRYTQQDVELLEFVSNQVAQAIERKRAEEQIRQNARRAQILANLSRVIAEASLDCQALLEVVVKSVVEAIGEGCFIALTSEDGEWLLPAAFYHPEPDTRAFLQNHLAARPIRLGEGISGRVAKTGQPVLLSKASLNEYIAAIPADFRPKEGWEELPSIFIAPLRAQARIIGTLGVARSQGAPYTQEEQAFLQEIGDRLALAIVNARLFQQEKARSRELDSLNSLSTVLRKNLTTEEMLAGVSQEIHRLLQVDGVMVSLRSAGNGRLKVALADGILAANQGREFHPDECTFGVGPRPERVFVTPDYQELRERIPCLYHGDGVGPAAFVQIQSEVETLGILVAARARGNGARAFTLDEARLLTVVSNMIGDSLRRTWLYEDAQRRLNRMRSLRRIEMAITNTMDLKVSVNVILEQVTMQTGVDAACIHLYDPHLQTLNYVAGRGFRTDFLKHTHLRLGEGYAGQAALAQKILSVSDLRNRKTDFLRSPTFVLEGFHTYYAIPLIAKGQVKGVMEIFHRAPLEPDQEWLDFLQTLAEQAAIAIDNASLFAALQRSNLDLTLAYDATIEGWSRALDLRDKETEGHTRRVTEMTLRLARAMGMGDSELVHVRRGALLHDIGKLGIPDHILLKPGKLTEEEWALMRKHPLYAYEMLAPIAYLKPALDIPRYHHEKWDGSGYPYGLRGEQIPLAARVFAVVDVWDALVSDRPYRPAWSREKALAYLRQESGRHFDPQVAEAFLVLLNTSQALLPR